MYANLAYYELDTNATRRELTELMLPAYIYIVIISLLASQICGRFLVKPITLPADSLAPKSGIIEYLDEIPVVATDVTPKAGITKYVEDIPIVPVEIAPKSGFTSFVDEIPVSAEYAEVEILDSESDSESNESEETVGPIFWEEGMKAPSSSFSEYEIIQLAILIEGEGGGLASLTELSGIAWAVVNRIYSNRCPYNDVVGVITQKGQFDGYTIEGYYSERSYWMACDVLARYEKELAGEQNVGRTLPEEYIFFRGDGEHNYFSVEEGGAAYVWGSTLESPYIS